MGKPQFTLDPPPFSRTFAAGEANRWSIEVANMIPARMKLIHAKELEAPETVGFRPTRS